MNVQNGYENSLNDYVNKEKIAVDLINSIGSLMYEKGIELVLFRQHLVNINISELMNCFDYAKDVVFKPLDISLVNDLVKELNKMAKGTDKNSRNFYYGLGLDDGNTSNLKSQYIEIIATNIKTEPSNVYKKNLNAEYTLLAPPQIPIIKNIGINPASKNK